MAEVKEKCLRARAKDRDAAHERIRKARSFKEFTDAEGAWNVIARGTVDAGRGVPGRAPADRGRDVQGGPGRGPARAVRGVRVRRVHRARPPRRATGRPDAPTTRTDRRAPSADAPTPTPRRTKPKPKAKATPAQYLADHPDRSHGAAARVRSKATRSARSSGSGPIPVSVARELLGDAILKLVITKGVDVTNVTHLGRSVTVAQQVALWWQSPDVHAAGLHPHPAARERPPRRLGRKPNTPASTRPTRSASTTTTSRPTTAGRSSTAPANDPWSHPTTPATPRTDRKRDLRR